MGQEGALGPTAGERRLRKAEGQAKPNQFVIVSGFLISPGVPCL